MTSGFLNLVTKRIRWARNRRALRRIKSLEEFQDLIDKLDEPIFKGYRSWDSISRRDVCAVLDTLGVDLRGKRFFDIGPGYGSALDIARERGAACCDFVDYDPFVCTFNSLKGHAGYRLDARRHLARISPHRDRYDFVWLKATFSADNFMDDGWRPPWRRYPPLEGILEQVDRLRAPGGLIVFCPHWACPDGRRVVQDVMNSSVTRTLQRRGYKPLPWIEGHNQEPLYPISFLKNE